MNPINQEFKAERAIGWHADVVEREGQDYRKFLPRKNIFSRICHPEFTFDPSMFFTILGQEHDDELVPTIAFGRVEHDPNGERHPKGCRELLAVQTRDTAPEDME